LGNAAHSKGQWWWLWQLLRKQVVDDLITAAGVSLLPINEVKDQAVLFQAEQVQQVGGPSGG